MSRLVICIDNESSQASLILGKVYRTLPDAVAEAHHMLRVIDEDKSEPDGYLYPAFMFAPIELPKVAERALMAANGRVRRGWHEVLSTCVSRFRIGWSDSFRVLTERLGRMIRRGDYGELQAL